MRSLPALSAQSPAMSDLSEARSADPAGEVPQSSEEPSRPTRGFLFADLRDYTRFVEEHGAAEAADLLLRYRALVRDVVSRYRGSEIKTEGDSFYVVFLTVSSAVQCGLAIVAGAAAVADGGSPIRVGVGVHAGETVETADGFVGSAVNIAARICAQARAGEVLVSDTVRTLTQGILPVTFESRGRRQLKGITEQIALYAAIPNDQAAASIRPVWRAPADLACSGHQRTVAVVVLAAAAYLSGPARATTGPMDDWRDPADYRRRGIDRHSRGRTRSSWPSPKPTRLAAFPVHSSR